MTPSLRLLQSLALLYLAVGAAQAAAPAGRVLAAVGQTHAVRGTQEIALAVGTLVEKGDTLRVGPASNLQVRFSDESVVALRPNTMFRIDDYQFVSNAESDKSVFSLLKGGMRTITGIIGRMNRQNYAVQAATATIGIRGTHFTLVNCSNDCRNADGSLAPNGTFGGVTDGKVVARNEAGEREFAKDQYFYVATTTSVPQTLLAPPSFLRDRLEGAGRGRSGSRSVADAQGSAPAAPTLPTLPPEPYNAAGRATEAMAWDYAQVRVVASRDDTQTYSTTESFQRSHQVSIGDWQTGDDPWLSHAYVSHLSLLELHQQAWAESTTFSDPFGGWAGTTTFQKSAAVDTGSDADAGNIHWGRHYEIHTEVNNRGTSTNAAWVHWALGDPVVALPTTGTFAYAWIGGTRPTDFAGHVGSNVNGGQLSVNFSANTMSTVQPITWTMPGNINYSVGFTNQAFSYDPAPLTSGTYNRRSTYANIDVAATSSCSGGCTLQSATVSPTFMGNNARGLGLGIATGAATGDTFQDTASVQIYKRASTSAPR